MLFIDDDDPEVRNRSEDRRASPEHDARVSAEGASPRPEPLGIGERRVEHCHRRVESIAESPNELRRQTDLGHQHERAPTLLENALHETQVYLGLAAARDAVEDEGAEAIEHLANSVDRHPLLITQLRPLSLHAKPRFAADEGNFG